MSFVVPYAGYDPTESEIAVSQELNRTYRQLRERLKAEAFAKAERDRKRFAPRVIHNKPSNVDLTCSSLEKDVGKARKALDLPDFCGTIKVKRAAIIACALHDMDPTYVFNQQRLPSDAKPAYQLFIRYLSARGLHAREIARMLHKDRTTVLHHLRQLGAA